MFRFLPWAGAVWLLAACNPNSAATEQATAARAAPPEAVRPVAARAAPPPAAATPSPAAHTDSLRHLSLALARANDSVQVEEFKQGDLNADGRPDYLVLARSKEPCAEATDESYCRILFIVLDEGAAGLRVAAANATLVGCSDCGGAGIGDPFQGLVIKGTFFSVETAFGACEKAYITTTFRYNRARRDWLLHRIDTTTASCQDTTDAAGNVEHQTVRDFGTVTFAKYEASQ